MIPFGQAVMLGQALPNAMRLESDTDRPCLCLVSETECPHSLLTHNDQVMKVRLSPRALHDLRKQAGNQNNRGRK